MSYDILVLARSSGISGYSVDGCGQCHAPVADPEVVVQILGPTIVFPNATYKYTVATTGGPGANRGLDVSVTDGTLTVTDSTNTQLDSGEITHTSTGTSQASWSYNWTAPSSYGPVTMYASSLSGNGNGRKDTNDLWNTAFLTLIVTLSGDTDGDYDVDYDDFIVLAGAYGSNSEQLAYEPNSDFDVDGDVDYDDFIVLAGNYGKTV